MADNERWLSDGDCELCRRRNYCSKPCTAFKRWEQKMFQEAIVRAAKKALKRHNANNNSESASDENDKT